MKKNAMPNNLLEEKEIPDFLELTDILQCDVCDKNCPYNRKNFIHNNSFPDSKWNCEKIVKLVRILELVVGCAFIILSVVILYKLFKNFFVTALITITLIGAMIWFENEFSSKIFKSFFEKEESKRKAKYEECVSNIEEENEAIRKKNNGETEEYEMFKQNAITITQKLENRKNNMTSDYEPDSEEAENDNLKNLFESLFNNLSILTDKIMPINFEYSYVQKFYNLYLPSLIESIDTYYSKNAEEISAREEKIFEKLLESYDTKIEHILNALKEQTEDDFINKMEKLQEKVLYNLGDE